MASRFRKPTRNPKFGVQENGDKTGNTVHPSIFKQARKSGQLNLSGRSMTKGDTFSKGTRACVTIFFIPRLTTLLVFRVASRGIKKKIVTSPCNQGQPWQTHSLLSGNLVEILLPELWSVLYPPYLSEISSSVFVSSWYFIQIYPVSEGYLRKIPVERRGKYMFSGEGHLTVLETGIFRK